MTSFFFKLCGLLAIGVIGFWWVGRGVWRARRAAREVDAARQAFPGERHALANRLLDAVNQTNKSHGPTWQRCDLLPSEPLLARDVATGELYALASVEVSLEADSSSSARTSTALFIWRDGQWASEGHVVFDLEPKETLKRYSRNLVITSR